jgi:hypothetical protein
MTSPPPTPAASIAELTRLRGQLEDLLAAFAAIRGGGVDAIMVGGKNEERLYTLTSADRPYRVIVQEMGRRGSDGVRAWRAVVREPPAVEPDRP